MIEISINLDGEGCLAELKAGGHALAGDKGQDIVCAAVTVLLRTAAKLLTLTGGLRVQAEAPEPGKMAISVQRSPGQRTAWLTGLTEFLVSGLMDLEAEYPDRVSVSTEYVQ